ncbi:hypothetical protein U0D24_21600 [Hafnia paralvei]|uniref:hypothetical protein n=1 Tax=Hafnia paralvei TaxID=546367 RepID=UPI002FDBAA42
MSQLTFRNGSVAVNMVFASQWGCEQTNVSFYQVVAIKGKKTVVVRRIRSQVVETESSMSGSKKALLNDFMDDSTLTRRVADYSTVPLIEISSYESAYLHDINEECWFSSWA